MNWYHLIGAAIAVAIVAALFILDRFKNRIWRRCCLEGCGKIRRRAHKIIRPPGENFFWCGSSGRWRFCVRGCYKLTYFICPAHGPELMVIDKKPISVLHGQWVKKFHHNQLEDCSPEDDPRLAQVAYGEFKRLCLGGRHLNPPAGSTDTPPLRLIDLFSGYLEDLSRILGVQQALEAERKQIKMEEKKKKRLRLFGRAVKGRPEKKEKKGRGGAQTGRAARQASAPFYLAIKIYLVIIKGTVAECLFGLNFPISAKFPRNYENSCSKEHSAAVP